jgi:hypothetical protein
MLAGVEASEHHAPIGELKMSFKPEVRADETGQWYDNALRFTTRAEAEAQVADLMMRWTTVSDTRVVECRDLVNYRYVGGRLEAVVPDEINLL